MTDHPEIRIGDRERHAAEDRLRDAYSQGVLDLSELEERLEVALRARTRSELEPLLADLPAPEGEVAVDRRDHIATESARPYDGLVGKALLLAIIIGAVAVVGFGFRPLAGADHITVFGSRTLTLDAADPDLRLFTLFGSVEVQVPEDVVARSTITPIFGSSECDVACTGAGATGDPSTVTVGGLTLFGSVEFTPGPPSLSD